VAGTEWYINGDKYEGEFADTMRQGCGIYTYANDPNILSYRGIFFENKTHGAGIEITRNRFVYNVKYYKDKLISKSLIKKDTT